MRSASSPRSMSAGSVRRAHRPGRAGGSSRRRRRSPPPSASARRRPPGQDARHRLPGDLRLLRRRDRRAQGAPRRQRLRRRTSWRSTPRSRRPTRCRGSNALRKFAARRGRPDRGLGRQPAPDRLPREDQDHDRLRLRPRARAELLRAQRREPRRQRRRGERAAPRSQTLLAKARLMADFTTVGVLDAPRRHGRQGPDRGAAAPSRRSSASRCPRSPSPGARRRRPRFGPRRRPACSCSRAARSAPGSSRSCSRVAAEKRIPTISLLPPRGRRRRRCSPLPEPGGAGAARRRAGGADPDEGGGAAPPRRSRRRRSSSRSTCPWRKQLGVQGPDVASSRAPPESSSEAPTMLATTRRVSGSARRPP